ncbi:MAG TPA: sulfatase-like hydrolase/transferase [Pseudonocardiaceae bacterium]|nr:sulfatase-like hydrolase/transferase [Pseudonocardiaceae bacterium]
MTTEEQSTDETTAEQPAAAGPSRRKRATAIVITTLACLLVLFALVGPDQLANLTPWTFLRVPIEGLVGVVLLLLLPTTARRVVAGVLGAILGVLTIVKLLDMGFFIAMSRPFDPVLDWAYYLPGLHFIEGELGFAGSIAVVVLIVILAVALVLLMTLAVMRLARIVVGHRTVASRTIAALTVIWVVCVVSGVQITPGEPIAARSAATLAFDDVRQVHTDILDQQEFTKSAAVDEFHNASGSDLLTGLRGKNVLLVFVESYGRIAVQGSGFSPQVDTILDNGTKALQAAGFASESAFLTSSTVGGGSWLAHSTLQSGLWINNQQRYNDLLADNRLSLTQAFRRAGWRTIGDDPSNIQDVPKATIYDYDKFYDALNVGYRGPKFSYATMPDQYIMQAFQHNELTNQTKPVMAEIDLVSSHSPWAPLPRMVPWNQLGNGSIFDPMPAQGESASDVVTSAAKLKTAYGQSIEYTLSTLISYLQTYGDKNTVMIFLGDHEPAGIITNNSADRDVPITIVAKDPSVLSRISSWGWQTGLRPNPQAPVWRMDTFRNKFLTAFGSRT